MCCVLCVCTHLLKLAASRTVSGNFRRRVSGRKRDSRPAAMAIPPKMTSGSAGPKLPSMYKLCRKPRYTEIPLTDPQSWPNTQLSSSTRLCDATEVSSHCQRYTDRKLRAYARKTTTTKSQSLTILWIMAECGGLWKQ